VLQKPSRAGNERSLRLKPLAAPLDTNGYLQVNDCPFTARIRITTIRIALDAF
jgi:hypothetical protein